MGLFLTVSLAVGVFGWLVLVHVLVLDFGIGNCSYWPCHYGLLVWDGVWRRRHDPVGRTGYCLFLKRFGRKINSASGITLKLRSPNQVQSAERGEGMPLLRSYLR